MTPLLCLASLIQLNCRILNIIVTGVSPYAFVVGFWPLKFWPRPSDTSNKCPVKSFPSYLPSKCLFTLSIFRPKDVLSLHLIARGLLP